ncbi:MAG TPA: sensor histidine kinase [Gemmatimonadaceae bacterium]|nr:sensor histidine kinase [Gemmatimonadaceae bacterium]
MSSTTPDSERELDASRRMLHVSERELQRILLDIHDGPVQYMYAALSQLELLRRALNGSPAGADEEVRERLGRIGHLLESGLNEIRSFIGAFRPPEFEGRDLRTLLEGLVMQHEAATDTEVVLDAPSALPALDLAAKIALYRVLQEGLSNAYRHGGGDRVVVRVRESGEASTRRLRMEIADNGAGFDPAESSRHQKFGLAGMRDRVEMVGGTFALHSTPGVGTTVAVEVPLS